MTYKAKYKNIKTTTFDGIVHDSAKEARRWGELLLLERAGKIIGLRRQVEFELIPPQYEFYERYSKTGKSLKDGKRLIERAVVYKADFVYSDAETGETVVEDTKGVKTKEYIIKRKMMLYRYGIRIKET